MTTDIIAVISLNRVAGACGLTIVHAPACACHNPQAVHSAFLNRMPHIMGHTSLLQAVYKEISSLHMVFATNPIFGVEFTVEDPVSGLPVHPTHGCCRDSYCRL